MDNYFEEVYRKDKERIQPGKRFTLYLVYCKQCGDYKYIMSSPPAGPGGTLSCPLCKRRGINGPHLEGAYGHVKARRIEVILPEEVNTDGLE